MTVQASVQTSPRLRPAPAPAAEQGDAGHGHGRRRPHGRADPARPPAGSTRAPARSRPVVRNALRPTVVCRSPTVCVAYPAHSSTPSSRAAAHNPPAAAEEREEHDRGDREPPGHPAGSAARRPSPWPAGRRRRAAPEDGREHDEHRPAGPLGRGMRCRQGPTDGARIAPPRGRIK